MRFAIVIACIAWGAGVHADAENNKKREDIGHRRTLGACEVVSSTRIHHPLILSAIADREAAAGDRLGALGAFDRTIQGDVTNYAGGKYSGTYFDMRVKQPIAFWGSSLVGGYRQGSGFFPSYEDYYQTNEAGEARLGIETSLLRDREVDKRRTAQQQSEIGEQISELAVQLRTIELVRLARYAFWEWAISHHRREVFRALLKTAKERDAQFITRKDEGDLAEFDQVDNQRQVLQRESQVLAAERALVRAEFELSLFYRDAQGNVQSVQQEYAPRLSELSQIPMTLYSIDESVDEALQHRPDISHLEKRIAQLELERSLAQNDRLPRLDLKGYLSREYGEGYEESRDLEFRTGVSLEIPLQTRGQDGRLLATEAKIRALSAQLQLMQERIRVDIQDAINAIRIAKERVVIAQRELNVAKQLETGERLKLSHGDSNLIFINLREQTTADAATRVFDALLEYHKVVAQFDAVVGRSEIARCA